MRKNKRHVIFKGTPFGDPVLVKIEDIDFIKLKNSCIEFIIRAGIVSVMPDEKDRVKELFSGFIEVSDELLNPEKISFIHRLDKTSSRINFIGGSVITVQENFDSICKKLV